MGLWSLQIPVLVVLALVAAVGYLLGRCSKLANSEWLFRSRRELRHAQSVTGELEKIALSVRKSLAKYHTRVSKFEDRVGRLNQQQQAPSGKELRREAEAILKPTRQLAARIAHAYDKIRQQSAKLITLGDGRTDPLTGLNNRRVLDAALADRFAMMIRYDCRFSLAIFDIDHFSMINERKGPRHGDRILQDLGKLFDECARQTDVVARCGGERFVVVMPQADLEGAGVFGERLRAKVEQQMPLTVSGGITAALDGDTQDSLFARAESALYSAKAAGRNCVFCHDGERAELVGAEVLNAPV